LTEPNADATGQDRVEAVRRDAADATRLSFSEPGAALNAARRAVENILTVLYATHLGPPPTRARLEDLLRKLVAEGIVTEHIQVPMHVVQVYGNYASHGGPAIISADYARPAVMALDQVVRWFLYDFLPDAAEKQAPELVSESGSRELNNRLKALCISGAASQSSVKELEIRALRSGFERTDLLATLETMSASGLVLMSAGLDDESTVRLA